jgi:hypothetical protein
MGKKGIDTAHSVTQRLTGEILAVLPVSRPDAFEVKFYEGIGYVLMV